MPCDRHGNDLPPNVPPIRPPPPSNTDYSPFDSQTQFKLADLFYRKIKMTHGRLDDLMQLWAESLPPDDNTGPPFASHEHLESFIDSIQHGGVSWQEFAVAYDGVLPEGNIPSWMTNEYTVIFRDPHLVLQNQLRNPDYAGEMDYCPRRVFKHNGKRKYKDFMSGNWAWTQAVSLSS